MPSHRPDFERFIARVHRRFVAWRLLERTGLGLLAGCAAGLPMVAVAIVRGVSVGPLAVGALGLGSVGGLLYGLLHHPTLHDAATEADRQLDTSDLLSTALTLRDNPDPWAGAVISAADYWSHGVAPSSVILNRLGARAWGGIGLATALLFALSLLPTYATPIEAGERSTKPPSTVSSHDSAVASTATPRRAVPDQHPEDLRPNPNEAGEPASRPSSVSDSTTSDRRSTSGPDGARGRGESHTASRSQSPQNLSESTQARNTSQTGRGADGAGRAAPSVTPGSSTASQAGGSESSTPNAPWKSSEWPQQAQQAFHALDSGQVPDSYRDVMHGYFDSH